jgi:hypothetical protein
MAEVSFDVRELYGKVGWKLPFPLALSGGVKDYSLLTRKERGLADAGFFTPDFGKPTWAEIQLGDIEFAIPPVLTVQGQLNVISTAVAGQNGSVKEVISVEDYRVNIKVMLTNNEFIPNGTSEERFTISLRDNEFPDTRVRELRNLFEEKQSVRVVSPYLSLFNMQYLLMTGISFPDLSGVSSIVPCEIQCVSDRPLEIQLEL